MTNIVEALQKASLNIERLDAEVLLAFVLAKSRSYLFTWPEQVLSLEQQQHFQALFEQRQQGMPVAYLLGEQEFWSLPLKVNQHTLIPRPETEEMVAAILNRFSSKFETLQLWDAGTGTGAIALALKSERPQWRITASDISSEALAVAKENSEKLALPIEFVTCSWLDKAANQSLDILVSNPPYIAASDVHLQALQYEPHSALVAENQGLADIAHLAKEAMRVLKPQGLFFVEHGYDQEQAVSELLIASGLHNVRCHYDLAGLPRFTEGQAP